MNQERMSLSAEVQACALDRLRSGLATHLIWRVPVIPVEFLTLIRIYGDTSTFSRSRAE